MTACQKIPPYLPREKILCEWVVSREKKDSPSETWTLRDVYEGGTRLLEEEWENLLKGDRFLLRGAGPQPIAEELYDRFQFVPPWLPKPLGRMNPSERKLFHHLLVSVQTSPADQAIAGMLRYVKGDAIVEDDLVAMLEAGMAGCVGFSNAFYFARAIVAGEPVFFIDVYQNGAGQMQFHQAVRTTQGPYDPAYQEPLAKGHAWRPMGFIDEWTVSLMNTAFSKRESGLMDAETYTRDVLRAFFLSPEYFRLHYPDHFAAITTALGALP